MKNQFNIECSGVTLDGVDGVVAVGTPRAFLLEKGESWLKKKLNDRLGDFASKVEAIRGYFDPESTIFGTDDSNVGMILGIRYFLDDMFDETLSMQDAACELEEHHA